MNPMMTSSSAESGLQLLGGGMNKQAHPEANAAGFNPIRSLLSQLQQHQEEHEHQQQPNRVPASASPPQQQQQQQLHQGRHQFAHQQQHQQQPQEISPSPPPLQAQSPPVSRSIWGDSNQPHEPKVINMFTGSHVATKCSRVFFSIPDSAGYLGRFAFKREPQLLQSSPAPTRERASTTTATTNAS